MGVLMCVPLPYLPKHDSERGLQRTGAVCVDCTWLKIQLFLWVTPTIALCLFLCVSSSVDGVPLVFCLVDPRLHAGILGVEMGKNMRWSSFFTTRPFTKSYFEGVIPVFSKLISRGLPPLQLPLETGTLCFWDGKGLTPTGWISGRNIQDVMVSTLQNYPED